MKTVTNESKKIRDILDKIKTLTLLEFKNLMNLYCVEILNTDLNTVLLNLSNSEKKISDDTSDDKKKEDDISVVNLKINSFSQNKKINIIKFIKNNNKDIKSLFEASSKLKDLPFIFKNLPKDEAEKLKSELLQLDSDIKLTLD